MKEFKGTLYVNSDPSGADVYINGNPVIDNQKIVKTPVIITDIPEGTYLIGFKIIGYIEDMVTTDVIGDHSSSVFGVLLPIQQPSPFYSE